MSSYAEESCYDRGGGILGRYFHEISLEIVAESSNACPNAFVTSKWSLFILLGMNLTQNKSVP